MPRRQRYEEIADDLRARIAAGEWSGPDDFLPTRRELATHYKAADTVIDKAMAILRAAGLTETLPGRGVYVKEPPAS